MSDLLDQLSKTLNSLTQQVNDSIDSSSFKDLYASGKAKVEELTALAKVTLDLNRAQAELDSKYGEIGKQYFEKVQQNPPQDFSYLFDEVSALRNEIELLRCEAEALKKSVVPSNSGADSSEKGEIIPFGTTPDDEQ